MQQLTIIKPDDFHAHLRDGELFGLHIPDSGEQQHARDPEKFSEPFTRRR